MIARLASVAAAAALCLATFAGCKKDEAAPAPSAGPAAASGTAPAAQPAVAYTRRASTCADIIAGLQRGVGKEAVVPGWGSVPKALQVLPPGAELCGCAADSKAPVIRSALFGDALGDFYKPLVTAVGCTWKGVDVVGDERVKLTQAKFKCPDRGGAPSTVHTDSGTEFYHFSY